MHSESSSGSSDNTEEEGKKDKASAGAKKIPVIKSKAIEKVKSLEGEGYGDGSSLSGGSSSHNRTQQVST